MQKVVFQLSTCDIFLYQNYFKNFFNIDVLYYYGMKYVAGVGRHCIFHIFFTLGHSQWWRVTAISYIATAISSLEIMRKDADLLYLVLPLEFEVSETNLDPLSITVPQFTAHYSLTSEISSQAYLWDLHLVYAFALLF